MRRSACIVGLLLASCLGTAARQSTLLPALHTAWQNMREQVAREVVAAGSIEASGDIMAADAALAAGDQTQVASVNWTRLEQLAVADIERRTASGDLSAPAAAILGERVRQFREARIALVTVTP